MNQLFAISDNTLVDISKIVWASYEEHDPPTSNLLNYYLDGINDPFECYGARADKLWNKIMWFVDE